MIINIISDSCRSESFDTRIGNVSVSNDPELEMYGDRQSHFFIVIRKEQKSWSTLLKVNDKKENLYS